MIDVYVHRSVQGADQHGFVSAQCFVSSVDGLGLPIGPVNELLKQSHGKDVRDVMIQHCGEENTSFTFHRFRGNKQNIQCKIMRVRLDCIHQI